jgi:hypothetical protein
MAESMELGEALKAMDEAGQRPDGFLIRLIATEGAAADLQPFSTSVYGLTVSRGYDLNTANFQKEDTLYHVYDIVAYVPFSAMESEMKETDAILHDVIKQSREMEFISGISQAVHFIHRPPEVAGWGTPSENLPENDSEDDDLF